MTPPNSTSDPVPAAAPAPLPSGRWVRVALAVSLAVNLAIVGVLAGALLRNGGAMHGEMSGAAVGFGPFTEALSKEDRSKLRKAFLAKLPEMRDGRRATRADFKELLVQLRAVPLDETGLRSVLDRQNARSAERLELGHNLIFDLVVAMSDDARQAFAARLEQSFAQWPKRRDASANQ